MRHALHSHHTTSGGDASLHAIYISVLLLLYMMSAKTELENIMVLLIEMLQETRGV